MEPYASGFSAGMKIEIRIPVPYAKMFTDWAVISAVDEDRISLQLSRDILPEGVSLRVGQILECRTMNNTSGCSHQAIVVSKEFGQELQLRLIGEIAADEHREFFRIDVFLPVICHYSRNISVFRLQKQWALQCKQRKAEEARRKRRHAEEQTRRQNSRKASPAIAERAPREDQHEFVSYDESWQTVMPQPVNICGGGMSLVIDREFAVDDYALVEILIPSSRRVVGIVVRVIFTHRVRLAGTDRSGFHTGMQFIFIDEADRSAIVNHIALIQTRRIRVMQGYSDEPLYDAESASHADGHFITGGSADDDRSAAARFTWISVMLLVGAIVCCGIIVTAVLYLVSSANAPFSDIGVNIGNSFDRYRSKGP